MVLLTRENGGDLPELSPETQTPQETDPRPEFIRYKDEGCEYAKSCLECPYPQCFYDAPHSRSQWLREVRNKEIIKLYSAGWQVDDLAQLFGVSSRTIRRALKG